TTDWVPGRYGSSLLFDGSDDYVRVSDTSDTNPGTADFTISSWMKYDVSKARSDAGGIFGKRNGTGDQYVVYLNTDDTLCYYVDDTTPTNAGCSVSTIDDNGWHHVVFVFDRDVGVSYYIDGIKSSDVDSLSSVTGSIDPVSFVEIASGNASVTGSGFKKFDGQLDEVRYYNYARTPAQIAWEYNRGGPIGWWKLDECSGTVAHDASGFANDGTITIGGTGDNTSAGTCTGASGQAWFAGATGKRNASLDFDGTDDYVDMSSSVATFEGLNEGTISGWFKTSNTAFMPLFSISDKDATSDVVYISLGNTTGSYSDESMAFIVHRTNITVLAMYVRHGETYYADNVWHHFAITTGDGNNRIMIDGVLQEITYNVGSASTNEFSNIDNADTMRIGNRDNSGIDYYHDGLIDELKIYNYALTEEQARVDYNYGTVRFN
ncbi:MAG TPA: LamG domain-containing protein, partial [bacterium]|nr:LamG domain-containing protein [bacterium]